MDELDDQKRELLAENQKFIRQLTKPISDVNWGRRKPTSNELVLFSDYYRALLSEAWLKDIDYRFQLEKLTELTGLSEHEINVYVEIGGWIGLDRKMEMMGEDERAQFWDFLSSIDNDIDEDAILAKTREQQARRKQEIESLNKLFADE